MLTGKIGMITMNHCASMTVYVNQIPGDMKFRQPNAMFRNYDSPVSNFGIDSRESSSYKRTHL